MESNFNTSFGRIEGLAKNFGKGILQGLVAGISVGAVTGFAKEVLNLADNLQNLSDQTGLSVQLLSGLKSPLEEAGTSMDAFAKGVFNLQKNLGNVDKDTDVVAQSIKRLGLNLNDLRNSSPDDFIKKVTDALAKIENPVERNTILFNLLGKSAKELGPAFQQLVGRFEELRAKGLTAADVKTLDDIGDALTRLKNQALLLGAEGAAGLLRFFSIMRDGPKVAAQLADATERAAKAFNLPKERIEGMSSREIIAQAERTPETFTQSRQAFRNARDELLNLREEFDKLNAVNKKLPTAPFKGISDGASKAKKETSELNNFLEGLEKQLASLQGKSIEELFGPQAALAADLDAKLASFKDNLRDKQLPIPKGLDQFFQVLKDKILAANQELTRFKDTLEGFVKFSDKQEAEANEALIFGDLTPEKLRELAQMRKQAEEFKKTLTLEGLPADQREAMRSSFQVDERLEQIETWRKAMIAAGEDVVKANADAAAQSTLAWNAFYSQAKNNTDQLTEFQRRAFERAFDAVTDLTKDAIGGQIRSWNELGDRVKKVLDEIASEYLVLTAKTAIFGSNFGSQQGGGQIGGLLGQLFSSGASSGFGSRPSGVEGPLMANGGFFSNILGAIMSAFGFHSGGVVGSAGTPRIVSPKLFYDAPRYHRGMMSLAADEVPAILQTGETVLPRGARMGGDSFQFHFHGVQDMDSFRRSRAQLTADLARAVKKGNKHL